MASFLPDPNLKARLATGETLGCHWLSLGAPALAEMAARLAPDAIVLDMQHGLWDRAGIEAAIGVVGGAAPVLVRPGDGSTFAIGAALDAGAAGVIVPLIETPGEAAAVAAAARYPPGGRRSGGGARPLVDFARYRAACAHLLVAVMIETARGVENAPVIAATEGIDMVFVGPLDLSLSLGAGPDDPRFEGALGRVRAACAEAKKACGIFTADAAAALARAGEGFGFVVAAHDTEIAGLAAASWRRFRDGLGRGG